MFPEETHVSIVKRIDTLEAEAYGLYRKLAGLRISLQDQWKVLPTGERWSKDKQQLAESNVR